MTGTAGDDRAPAPGRQSRGPAGVASVIRWVRWLAMARAPRGKAGQGLPSVHRDTTRLVFFSDAVFAISITLLVLEIRPPSDYTNLLHGLAALWPSYLAYAVTFLFIGQVWANHHVMFDHIRAADRVVLQRSFHSPPPSSPGPSEADTASEPPSSSTASRST
jgi:hypothetical protein